MKYLPLLLAGMLLSGCASYQWRHATRYDANFDEDSYQCKKEAAQAFPPNIEERMIRPPHMLPPALFCGPHRCEQTAPRWTDAEMRNVDVNEAARDDLYGSCLKARGWIKVRVD